MKVLSGFCFICLLVFGLARGAKIGTQESLKSLKEHPSLGIINGKKVPITKYPYMASLKVYGSIFGAGVIIDKRWILTTAFNVAFFDKSALEFRVGSNRYNNGGQILKIEEVIYHKNYTGNWDYDIALVKVGPINFGKKIKSIGMATKTAKAGKKVDVSGWGADESSPSEVLMATQVTVYDWQACKKNYTVDLTSRLMCTYDQNTGPCVYDFGGPLVADNVVYGLFAGGYTCHPGVNPVLYSDVSAYYPWIKNITSSSLE